MDRNDRIQNEVRQTLEAFGKAERLPADPYFTTRVLARIDSLERHEWQTAIIQVVSRVIRPVFIVFIIAINIITTMVYLNRSKDIYNQTRKQLISTIAEELSLGQDQQITY